MRSHRTRWSGTILLVLTFLAYEHVWQLAHT